MESPKRTKTGRAKASCRPISDVMAWFSVAEADCASKAAMDGLLHGLVCDLSQHNIQVRARVCACVFIGALTEKKLPGLRTVP